MMEITIPTRTRVSRPQLKAAIEAVLPAGAYAVVEGVVWQSTHDTSGKMVSLEKVEPRVSIIAPDGVTINEAAVHAVVDAHNPAESDEEEAERMHKERENEEKFLKGLKKRITDLEARVAALEKAK